MSVEVVVPFRGGCPHRERAWEWVSERLPYPVRIGECGEPWIKAHAVMPAIEASSADVIVVSDADVWCEGIPEAVDAVRRGAPWALPHSAVYRLTEEATLAYMAGGDHEKLPLTQRAYKGILGGGYVVAARDVLLSVPLDPRFVGWGQEDECWARVLTCLVGPHWRGKAPLIHLYHPPQERITRRWGSQESKQLARRYHKARRDPAAMRALLREARDEDADHHQEDQAAREAD